MEIKELTRILRNDYASKIRPLLIKDKCEICGADEELELHHKTQFALLLDKALGDLHIVINVIGEEELEKIRNYMLGLQLTNDNITLCKHCHREGHKLNEESNRIRNEKQFIGTMKRQLEKEHKRKIYEETILKPYLESIVDKGLGKEEKEELIEKIDYKVDGHQKRSYSQLNSYLNTLGYSVISKRKKVKINGKWEQVRQWIVSNKDK